MRQEGSRAEETRDIIDSMFTELTERLSKTFRNLMGRGVITSENIQDALSEVRTALLEADVALSVVKDFIGRIKTLAVGQEVLRSLTPGQALVKIVYEELQRELGGTLKPLQLQVAPPAVILMVGLQGAGKTTTAAKLAKWLKETQKKRVLLVSVDIYRPAAIIQLQQLAEEVDALFFPSTSTDNPVEIVNAALKHARHHAVDVVIVDSAGRLHIDTEMMQEIARVHAASHPTETLFVVDSLMGQDAVNAAKAFHETLPLTGVVLTKVDGDSRGGAALSVYSVTKTPIKFLGVGEKTDGLELFHPERIASRILGMGDVLTLVEQVEKKIDLAETQKLVQKFQQGKRFTLEDFATQLQQLKKMGGIAQLLDKMPGMAGLPSMVKERVDDKLFSRMEAIIYSMTPHERKFPDVIQGSRKRRVALGSGTDIQSVSRLLKQFTQMQKLMKKTSKNQFAHLRPVSSKSF